MVVLIDGNPRVGAYCGWSGPRLDEVLRDLGPTGVLLGIAVDQWDVLDRSDRLVLLELDEVTQVSRVESRHPLVRQQIRRGDGARGAGAHPRGA